MIPDQRLTSPGEVSNFLTLFRLAPAEGRCWSGRGPPPVTGLTGLKISRHPRCLRSIGLAGGAVRCVLSARSELCGRPPRRASLGIFDCSVTAAASEDRPRGGHPRCENGEPLRPPIADALHVVSRCGNWALTMSIAEIIYAHSRRLPEQAAREALSYLEVLEHRYGVVPPAVGADDTEAFLNAVSGGLSDDFPDDIADADLGTDVPRSTVD